MISSPIVQTVAVEDEYINSLTTFVLASSVSVGSNLIEVKRGRMGLDLAVGNALVKGVLATAVLGGSRPVTALQVVGTACLLGGVGYFVDSMMKPDVRSNAEDAEEVSP